jgi:hypothetical protein
VEASSVGKRGYGGKGRLVTYLGRLDHWILPCPGPFSLGTHFETYESFISLIFNFFFPVFRSKPRILNHWIVGHASVRNKQSVTANGSGFGLVAYSSP